MGMAYTVPSASVVVMVFAIWLRMNLKESPVFEKVNDSNQPTAKPAPAGSMFQSKSFWLATGLRFGQAGNSGLIQTFLAGYLVQTLLFNKAIPTDALMISSILGFMTIPFLGWLSDKIGRRIPYIIMNTSAIVLAWPMLSIIVDKSYAPSTIMVALIVIHNCAVLGLFALENITMAEMFGCKKPLYPDGYFKRNWWSYRFRFWSYPGGYFLHHDGIPGIRSPL